MDLHFHEPRLYPVSELIPFRINSIPCLILDQSSPEVKVKGQIAFFLRIHYVASYLVDTFFWSALLDGLSYPLHICFAYTYTILIHMSKVKVKKIIFKYYILASGLHYYDSISFQ